MTRAHAFELMRFLLILATTPIVTSVDPYILCPLGNSPVNLERDQLTRNWFVTSDPSDSTIEAKPCWCVTLGNQYPAFCPNPFDTCRIEEGSRVTCLKLNTIRMKPLDWLVPVTAPLVILVYSALLLSCCFSRRGLAARDYLLINLVSRCGRDQERYAHWMDASLRRNTLRFRAWACDLLERGIERERNSILETGESDPWTEPTRLELKTKIYHSAESLVSVVEPSVTSTGMDPEQTECLHQLDQKQANEVQDECTTGTTTQQDTVSMLETDNDGVLCAICYCHIEEGNRIGNIPCNHVFHVPCLKPWLKKKNQCPICSTPTIAIPQT